MATRIIRTADEPPFSWGAAIAGTVTALAIVTIFMLAGAGLGLLTAGSFGASATMTGTVALIAALWMLLSHSMGFLAGGYVAGRLGSTWERATQAEGNFRDGTHGFVSWALAVVLSVTAAVTFGASATTALTAAGVQGTATGASQNATNGRMGYTVDTLLRPSQTATTGTSANDPSASREQLTRIFTYGLAKGQLSNADRSYAAQIISTRAGISQQEAQARIDDAQQKATQAAKTAAKVAAITALWLLFNLLVGAIAAVFGGIWGGDDREGRETLPVGWGHSRRR